MDTHTLNNKTLRERLNALSAGGFERNFQAAISHQTIDANTNDVIVKFQIPVNNPLTKFIHAELKIHAEMIKNWHEFFQWFDRDTEEPNQDGSYMVELEDGRRVIAQYVWKLFYFKNERIFPVRFALPALRVDEEISK